MGAVWTKRKAKAYRRDMPAVALADLGTGMGLPVVVEEIALTPSTTTKRARRCDPLDAIRLTDAHRCAAVVYRQAFEHVQAGRGMGPLPWGRDAPGMGSSERMPAQMRALSAAVMYRRGVQAMGLAACEGVVNWVVLRGLPLCDYDATRKWRNGAAKAQLEAALERLAGEYGV